MSASVLIYILFHLPGIRSWLINKVVSNLELSADSMGSSITFDFFKAFVYIKMRSVAAAMVSQKLISWFRRCATTNKKPSYEPTMVA